MRGRSRTPAVAAPSKAADKVKTLLSILAREATLGFNDGAVIGGLDEFLNRWRSELSDQLGEGFLPGRDYASMSVDARRKWAMSIRERVEAAGRIGLSGHPARPTTASVERSTAPVDRPTRSSRSRAGRRSTNRASEEATLDTKVADLPFIRRPAAAKLERIGVATLRDLIYLFPFRHVDYADVTRICDLEVDVDKTVIAKVLSVQRKKIGPPPGAAHATVSDGTGWMDVTWFRQPYLATQFKPGTTLVLSGRVQAFRNRARFQNPDYEVLDGQAKDELVHAGILLPVYPSTEGLVQRTLRNAAKKALDIGLPLIREYLPVEIRRRHRLTELPEAVHNMHLPAAAEDRSQARRRLAFDELFLSQLAVQKQRADWRKRGQGVAVPVRRAALVPFLESLPFRLTDGQNVALDEVLGEMATNVPMGRLLQGEVGSGKTMVAIAALLAVAASDLQGALMAPTEVLTEQHFLSLSRMLGAAPEGELGLDAVRVARVPGLEQPVRIGLLIGSLPRSVKSEVHRLLSGRGIDIVIGTHALIEEAVEIPDLALAVVDEQHRFGVQQRAALHGKGRRPHLLAMSATPIPRSLALTLYGDLDLSTLRELPAGRRAVETRWLRSQADRGEAYQTVRREVARGRQAFVVCPLIDESDQIEARAATVEFQRLSTGEFRELNVGLLHGRMSLADKQAVMERFRSRAVDVLVATPVIEVGIDVPNATVMLVESADRFGLTQLHQLRGRIGRGGQDSYCLMLADDPGAEARQRLTIIERSSDGFHLAEEDLRLRGPGDYVGSRQSGFPELKVATLSDLDLMAIARAEAITLLATDPGLTARKHAALAVEMERAAVRAAEIS